MMRFVLGWLKSAAAVLLTGVIASNAMAGVVINIGQSGSDVVFTISGSLSLGTPLGSSSGQSFNQGASLAIVIEEYPSEYITISTNSNSQPRSYNISGYAANTWGTIESSRTASSSALTGIDYFFFLTGTNYMQIPGNYSFGTAISGTATFSNETLLTMGITNQGTYVYTVSGLSGASDTVTFVIGSGGGGGGGGAVPEPASGAIAALLMGGAALRKWRKKSHKDESANFDSLAS